MSLLFPTRELRIDMVNERKSFGSSQIRYAAVDGANLCDMDFRDVTFSQCAFYDSSLMDSTFCDVRMSACVFDDCQLDSTDFGDAKISYTSFNGCDLLGASFRGAELCGVSFVNCDLYMVDFETTSLVDVDFDGARRGAADPDIPGWLYVADGDDVGFGRLRENVSDIGKGL